MYLHHFEIDKTLPVADIVAKDFRTADVFRRYGIAYCCGGKHPLERACEMQGIDTDEIRIELENAIRIVNVPNNLDFKAWEPAFLIDYILNVHHYFMENSLAATHTLLIEFAAGHAKKFPMLVELEQQFNRLVKSLRQAMFREETEVFPYIRQLAHAHKHKEPYAGLFIKTLRKPVEETFLKGQSAAEELIFSIRNLTNFYTPPDLACINHKVVLAKLRELDNDLVQHLFLEQQILFPKVAMMEKELLQHYIDENPFSNGASR